MALWAISDRIMSGPRRFVPPAGFPIFTRRPVQSARKFSTPADAICYLLALPDPDSWEAVRVCEGNQYELPTINRP